MRHGNDICNYLYSPDKLTIPVEIVRFLWDRGFLTQPSLRKWHLDIPGEFHTVPRYLYSVETLDFCGFKPIEAETILKLWLDLPQPNKYDFGEFMTNDITANQEPTGDMNRWRSFMNWQGINEELQDYLFHEISEDELRTASCSVWLKDTIQERWAYLLELDIKLRNFKAEKVEKACEMRVPKIWVESSSARKRQRENESQNPEKETSTKKKRVRAKTDERLEEDNSDRHIEVLADSMSIGQTWDKAQEALDGR